MHFEVLEKDRSTMKCLLMDMTVRTATCERSVEMMIKVFEFRADSAKPLTWDDLSMSKRNTAIRSHFLAQRPNINQRFFSVAIESTRFLCMQIPTSNNQCTAESRIHWADDLDSIDDFVFTTGLVRDQKTHAPNGDRHGPQFLLLNSRDITKSFLSFSAYA